jgi:hypothetical protein
MSNVPPRGLVLSKLSDAWLAGFVAVALLLAQGALAASPVPAFPKDGTVAVQDVPDSFVKLRGFLAEHRSPIGAKYHVAVVAFTDPLNRKGPGFGDASGEYLKRLVEKWRVSVDTENAVIILLGLHNQDVSIHPFSRWARLGWKDYQVVKTLESSQFASFARASDYESALRALVGAIDAELSRRLRDQENQEQRIRELLSQAQAKSWEYEALAKQSQYDPPQARQLHERAVAAAASAQSTLAAGDPRKAHELAQAAARDAEEAALHLAKLRETELASRDRWRQLKKRAEALEQRLVGADFEVTRVRWALKDATRELEAADRLIREHNHGEAASQLSMAELSLGLAVDRITSEKAERERRASARVFFLRLGVAILGVILLAWLFVKRWRSAHRGRAARELFQQWETLLGRLGDGLVKFEDEHALALGLAGQSERFDESSPGPVFELVREVDRLFLAFEAAQRVLSGAKGALDRAGPLLWLRERPYERAIELLTVKQVVIRSDELTYRKPYLPRTDEVQIKPQQLLAELQASWERVVQKVDSLETHLRSAWEQLNQLQQGLGELEALELSLLELGLPWALRAETAELGRKLQSAREQVKTDPQAALKKAEALGKSLAGLRERTATLSRAVSHLEKELPGRRAAASAALEQLRAQGFTVEEAGFEPSAMLAHIDKMSAAAMKALRGGKHEAAEKSAREALETAEELLELCERARRSREESPGLIAELEGRISELRTRIPERQERIRGLRQLYKDSSLQPALDNAEEASAVLDQAAGYLTEARACLTAEVQRYLASEELISRASERLEAVSALFQEIETKAADLAQVRQAAEEALKMAARPYEDLQGLMTDAPFASQETQAAHKEATRALNELKSATEAQRPDWPRLREQAKALQVSIAATVESALAEWNAHQKARTLLQELPTRREAAVKALSAGKFPEHDPAQVLYRKVCQELDQTLALTKQPGASWPRLLSALEQLAQTFDSVKAMATLEPTRAERARKALAAAEAALHSAEGTSFAGVGADLKPARACLFKARERLLVRDYAAVFHKAEEAQQETRKAINAAHAEAAKLERKREEAQARTIPPEASTSSFSQFAPFVGPARPSLGSSSGRSGFGASSSRRRK